MGLGRCSARQAASEAALGSDAPVRTTEMMTPKTQALIMEVTTSQAVTARAAESNITFAGTSYTSCANNMLAAKPADKIACVARLYVTA